MGLRSIVFVGAQWQVFTDERYWGGSLTGQVGFIGALSPLAGAVSETIDAPARALRIGAIEGGCQGSYRLSV